MTSLTTGRYYATTLADFYELTLGQASNVFLHVTPDSSSAIYGSNLQYLGGVPYWNPVSMEAGNYTIQATYGGSNGVTEVYIPSQSSFDSLLDLSSGSYKASSWINIYALNIRNGGDVFIVPSGDSASAVIYDTSLNFVTYATSAPLHLKEGNYVVVASYNGYKNGVLTVNIPEALRTNDTSIDGAPVLNGDDTFYGSVRPDLVQGFDGNDTYIGSSGGYSGDVWGPDAFYGGNGNDTALYQGRASEYDIVVNASFQDFRKLGTALISGVTVSDSNRNRDGTDYLHEVERLKFTDMTLNLAVKEVAGSIPIVALDRLAELYVAFFNRVPDGDGLAYWIGQYKAGKTISDIADSFYSAGVHFSELTGYRSDMSDAAFVNVVYRNVLGRSEGADADGLTYWTSALANGTHTKGTLVSSILDAAHGSTFSDPTNAYHWVQKLLDNKLEVAKQVAADWGVNYNSSEESIAKGMAIAAAVTPDDTHAAIALVGVHPEQISHL